MILIFCEHSTENNVPGSARTIWSGKGCCIDMMISLQENPTLAIGPMAKPRLCIKLLICDLLRSELVCLIQTGLATGLEDQRVISRSTIVLYVPTPHVT